MCIVRGLGMTGLASAKDIQPRIMPKVSGSAWLLAHRWIQPIILRLILSTKHFRIEGI